MVNPRELTISANPKQLECLKRSTQIQLMNRLNNLRIIYFLGSKKRHSIHGVTRIHLAMFPGNTILLTSTMTTMTTMTIRAVHQDQPPPRLTFPHQILLRTFRNWLNSFSTSVRSTLRWRSSISTPRGCPLESFRRHKSCTGSRSWRISKTRSHPLLRRLTR